MIEHRVHLLSGQFESKELEEKTVGCGYYSPSCNATYLDEYK